MRFYGDNYVEMMGEIIKIEKNFIKIQFHDVEKCIYIPRFMVKDRQLKTIKACDHFLIPEWFLIKQRIIKHLEIK